MSNNTSDTVSAINTSSNTVVATLSVGAHPTRIAISAPLPLPPSAASFIGKRIKNDFGLVKEYFIELHWNASTSSNLQGYYLYRNGILIATLPATSLSFEDHNLNKDQFYTYSLQSFNSNGASTSVTITIGQ